VANLGSCFVSGETEALMG